MYLTFGLQQSSYIKYSQSDCYYCVLEIFKNFITYTGKGEGQRLDKKPSYR